MKVDSLWVINPKPQYVGPELQLDNLHCCIDSIVDIRLRNWVRRKFDCF
jgi:hypothetical protein